MTHLGTISNRLHCSLSIAELAVIRREYKMHFFFIFKCFIVLENVAFFYSTNESVF